MYRDLWLEHSDYKISHLDLDSSALKLKKKKKWGGRKGDGEEERRRKKKKEIKENWVECWDLRCNRLSSGNQSKASGHPEEKKWSSEHH